MWSPLCRHLTFYHILCSEHLDIFVISWSCTVIVGKKSIIIYECLTSPCEPIIALCGHYHFADNTRNRCRELQLLRFFSINHFYCQISYSKISSLNVYRKRNTLTKNPGGEIKTLGKVRCTNGANFVAFTMQTLF